MGATKARTKGIYVLAQISYLTVTFNTEECGTRLTTAVVPPIKICRRDTPAFCPNTCRVGCIIWRFIRDRPWLFPASEVFNQRPGIAIAVLEPHGILLSSRRLAPMLGPPLVPPPHGPCMPLPIHPHVHAPNDTRHTHPVPHPHHCQLLAGRPAPPSDVGRSGIHMKGRPVRSEATPFRVLPMFFPWRIEHRSINQSDSIASVSFSASP